MNQTSILESILFVASQPLSIQTLATACESSAEDITRALDDLSQKYSGSAGIHLVVVDDGVQFVTNPAHATYVDAFVKSDAWGELTKAQLETLTVIAYQGPITRPELEEIRGVNCAIIIRNLLMRGLIREEEQSTSVLPTYHISIDALRELGVSSSEELPEYDELHAHPHIEVTVSDSDSV